MRKPTLHILDLARQGRLIAGAVLNRSYHKAFSGKFGKIRQMSGLIQLEPGSAANPDDAGIGSAAVLWIDEIHLEILHGVAEPAVTLGIGKVGDHRELRFLCFYLNSFLHEGSSLSDISQNFTSFFHYNTLFLAIPLDFFSYFPSMPAPLPLPQCSFIQSTETI